MELHTTDLHSIELYSKQSIPNNIILLKGVPIPKIIPLFLAL